MMNTGKSKSKWMSGIATTGLLAIFLAVPAIAGLKVMKQEEAAFREFWLRDYKENLAADFSAYVQPGMYSWSRDELGENRYSLSGQTIYQGSVREHILQGLARIGGIKADFVDGCKQGPASLEGFMKCAQGAFGKVTVEVPDPSKLKFDAFEKREIEFLDTMQFRCPNGQCVYAYTREKIELSPTGLEFCKGAPQGDVPPLMDCNLAGQEYFFQEVLAVSSGEPNTWRPIVTRISRRVPFLDEWAPRKALELPEQ